MLANGACRLLAPGFRTTRIAPAGTPRSSPSVPSSCSTALSFRIRRYSNRSTASHGVTDMSGDEPARPLPESRRTGSGSRRAERTLADERERRYMRELPGTEQVGDDKNDQATQGQEGSERQC